jgi:hypothetical protein
LCEQVGHERVVDAELQAFPNHAFGDPFLVDFVQNVGDCSDGTSGDLRRRRLDLLAVFRTS